MRVRVLLVVQVLPDPFVFFVQVMMNLAERDMMLGGFFQVIQNMILGVLHFPLSLSGNCRAATLPQSLPNALSGSIPGAYPRMSAPVSSYSFVQPDGPVTRFATGTPVYRFSNLVPGSVGDALVDIPSSSSWKNFSSSFSSGTGGGGRNSFGRGPLVSTPIMSASNGSTFSCSIFFSPLSCNVPRAERGANSYASAALFARAV